MDMSLPVELDRDAAAPTTTLALVAERKCDNLLAALFAAAGWRVDVCPPPHSQAPIDALPRCDLLMLATDGLAGDPIDALRELRSRSDSPLAVVGPSLTDTDQVLLLELGADDVLGLPLAPRLILARCRALLRRGRGKRRACVGALQVDPSQRRCWHGSRSIELTATEVELLHALVAQAGRPVERARLTACLRSERQHVRTLDVMVSRLRRHLLAQGVAELQIRAVPGYGYCLRA